MEDKVTPDEAIAAARDLPAPDAAEVAIMDPALWAIESFAVAQNEVYTDLIGAGAGPFNLTQEYQDSALETARERAALAGAHLAHLINAALR